MYKRQVRYSVYQDSDVITKFPALKSEMKALEHFEEHFGAHALGGQIFEIASTYSSKAVFGTLTIEEAIDQMAAELETLVKENPPEEPYY